MRATLLLALAATARSETWEPLHDLARRCPLVVRAKAAAAGGERIRFQVLESWRGKFDADRFLPHCVNGDGEYLCRKNEHGADVVAGQEIVFFFGGGAKLGPHTTSFPVVDGRVLYASTSDDPELRRWWTVGDVEKRIRALALPMAVSACGRYRLQLLERGDRSLTFLVEPKDRRPWHPSRDLFAEAPLRLDPAPHMVVAKPGGTVEIREKAAPRPLGGLAIGMDLLRATRSTAHVLEARSERPTAEVVAGPFTFRLVGPAVHCTVARNHPIRELDTSWFFAALRLEDARGRRLVSREGAWTHRGGGATYRPSTKGEPRYPLALSLALPTKVERRRVSFSFPR